MKPERQLVSDQPSDVARRDAEIIGFACAVLGSRSDVAGDSLTQRIDLVHSALRHRQLKFYFDEQGRPAGYVIWVQAATDVEQRFISLKRWVLHHSEWNEGDQVWIVDFVARPGYVPAIVQNLRFGLFSSLGQLRYARWRRGALQLREINRQPGCASLQVLRA